MRRMRTSALRLARADSNFVGGWTFGEVFVRAGFRGRRAGTLLALRPLGIG